MSKFISRTLKLGFVLPPQTDSDDQYVLKLNITSKKSKQELLEHVDRMRDAIKDMIEQSFPKGYDGTDDTTSQIEPNEHNEADKASSEIQPSENNKTNNAASDTIERGILKWTVKNGDLDIIDLLVDEDTDCRETKPNGSTNNLQE